MKRTFRILATFLSIALIICALPQSVLAQIGDLLSTPDAEATETVSPDIYVLGEVIDNRTETSKTFRMSDGSFIAADYGQVIHYAGEDGTWTDYDNTLTFSEASARDVDDMAGYGNTGSNLRIKLANNSNSNNLVKLTFGNYKVSMHLVGANKSKALEVYPAMEDPTGNDIDSAATLHKFSAGAIYEDILPDVDLEYIISGGSVKENIIIKDTADSYTYTFELKLQGLTPEVDSEGNILLKDETTNITQLVIPAGYMFDANGAYSDAVTYSIAHKNGKKYTLTVTADADWINANDRAFPVTVDPTVEAENASGGYIEDSYVQEGAPNAKNYLSSDLYTGYDALGRQTRIYIKLSKLPEIPLSSVVVSATLTLVQHTSIDRTDSYSGTANELQLAARKVLTEWEETTLSWNNKPSDGAVLDYITVDRDSAGTYYRLDVTSATQEWYKSSATNHGITIYPFSEFTASETYAQAGFYSSNYSEILLGVQPVFTVHYRDTKGLESTWTYASHGAGVAGVGYVNGFNGNLVFVHRDMTTEGSIIPITVNHVYNSFVSGKDFAAVDGDINAPITVATNHLVGKGWKLSIQETLVPHQIDGSDKEWYVYNDADGTELYFYRATSDSNEYISEDGFPLAVTINADGTATMADDYGNVKRFRDGRISEIEDVYGNVKRFDYSADRVISVRYRPAGETAYTTQLGFSYNTSGYLARIANAYNITDYVEYEYSTTYNGTYSKTNGGYLRKVTYGLGGYTLFDYHSDGTLASVVNGDTNHKVSYTYYGKKRILSVTESVGTSTGQKVSFS